MTASGHSGEQVPDRDVDAVVVGAGLNGLTAAARLARAGFSVQVLEARDGVGGSAATGTIEFGDGRTCRVSLGLQELGQLRTCVVRELELERHGLQIREFPVLGQTPGGAVLEVDDAHLSRDSWLTDVLRDLDGLLLAPGGLEQSARLALMPRLLSAMARPASELSSEIFAGKSRRSVACGIALEGTGLGPSEAGTGLQLLSRLIGGDGDGALRRSSARACGPEGIAGALERAATSAGADIRTGVGVERIVTDGSRVVGVETTNGELLRARVTLSSLDARATLLGLVGAPRLPVSWVRRLQRGIRYRGSMARLDLVVEAGVAEEVMSGLSSREATVVHANLSAMESSHRETRYGRCARVPWLTSVWSSAPEDELDHAVLSINAYGFPYDALRRRLAAVDENALQDEVRSAILETISASWPQLQGGVLATRLRTPLDFCSEFFMSEGHVLGGEETLEQMFGMRPFPEWHQKQLSGLELIGRGAQPGLGWTALPGWLGAGRVLAGA